MSKTFEMYVCDVETTGLDPIKNDPIEISIYRLSTDEQRSWFVRPLNLDSMQEDALRVNRHRAEDLRGLTKLGQERYLEPKKVAVEIENWLTEDMTDSGSRAIVGHNATFDRDMLREWWRKLGQAETFPFSDRFIVDTMTLEFMHDLIGDAVTEQYSLFALTRKHGIKNDAAHTAAADVRATVALFRKQMEAYRRRLKG